MGGMAPTRDELLEIATGIARLAAETAGRMRAEGVAKVATKSTATDVVTAADRFVERQVITALGAVRPEDTVLGEEYGDSGTPGRSAVRWILDPIDGTVNYLYGLPHYAVSLAAEVDGEVVVGVVRNAATGDEWTAIRGRGATGPVSDCAARRRPIWGRPWWLPGSGTTRPDGCTRPVCWRN